MEVPKFEVPTCGEDCPCRRKKNHGTQDIWSEERRELFRLNESVRKLEKKVDDVLRVVQIRMMS